MSYNMFLDDERNPPKPDRHSSQPPKKWVVVRSAKAAMDMVREKGIPKFISFDYTLSQSNVVPQPTGLDFAKELVEYCKERDYSVFEFKVHSQHPTERITLERFLSEYYYEAMTR